MCRRGILSVVIMAAAFVIGLWLIIAPWLEKQAADNHQEKFLESITAGQIDNGVDEEKIINPTASPIIEAENKPFITEPPEPSEEAQKILLTPVPAAISEPLIPTAPTNLPMFTPPPEPLADFEFPEAIVGLGILTIDKINLRLPVAEGISEAGLKIALGHVPETAAIGETGNAVVAGHRSYDYGRFFNRLDEVAIGDIIGYQAKNGEITHFTVFEIAEIYPDDQIAFIQPSDTSIITLYTCTPLCVATHRLIVRAEKTILKTEVVNE